MKNLAVQRFLRHPLAGAAATGQGPGESEERAPGGAGGGAPRRPEAALDARRADPGGVGEAGGLTPGAAPAAKGKGRGAATGAAAENQNTPADAQSQKLQSRIQELEAQLADRQTKLAARMSADELRLLELDEKEAKLAQREAELALERRQRYATEAILAAGLGQDSEKALRLREFVMAEDEADIKGRVQSFKALLQSYVAEDVQRVFKAGGRSPEAGEGAAGQDVYEQRIGRALAGGNLGEAAYWTRKKAEEGRGG